MDYYYQTGLSNRSNVWTIVWTIAHVNPGEKQTARKYHGVQGYWQHQRFGDAPIDIRHYYNKCIGKAILAIKSSH